MTTLPPAGLPGPSAVRTLRRAFRARIPMRALALAAMAVVAGCAGGGWGRPDEERGGEMRFLALGDSYTIGEGVADGGRWPERLAGLLRERGIGIGDPRIIARTGWTTDELDAAIDEARPEGPHALVTLLIGVNNQYRGRPLDEYATQFGAFLERAVDFAGGRAARVLVLSIPDWGRTRFGRESGRDLARVAHELDAFNAAARAICERRGVAFVDIAPVSREHGGEAEMTADDGLHPSRAMYALWMRRALPVAKALLEG
jgi:lysophospholipase L1-like esterase